MSSYGLFEDPKIGEQLLRMRSMQLIDRFDLDEQASVNQDVDLIGGWKMKAVIVEWDGILLNDFIAHATELGGQKSLVDTFEQTGAQILM